MKLKNKLQEQNLDFESYDFSFCSKELLKINPDHEIKLLNEYYNTLPLGTKDKIAKLKYKELFISGESKEFGEKIRDFLYKFGHLNNRINDFSSVSWRETPDIIMDKIINYKSSEEKNKFNVDLDCDKVIKYKIANEKMSFLFTYGYELFRTYFMHIADIFFKKGYISAREDIYYLTLDEIKKIVLEDHMSSQYKNKIGIVKDEFSKYEHLKLPELILSDTPPLIVDTFSEVLDGLTVSAGCSTGAIKVIRSNSDCTKFNEGDILVMPYLDVKHAPLFIKASAIVAEAGGILSQGSIAARETRIPAVVSVKDACRLKDGTIAAVDGYSGKVYIIKEAVSK